jgi:hypothetical protein
MRIDAQLPAALDVVRGYATSPSAMANRVPAVGSTRAPVRINTGVRRASGVGKVARLLIAAALLVAVGIPVLAFGIGLIAHAVGGNGTGDSKCAAVTATQAPSAQPQKNQPAKGARKSTERTKEADETAC